MAGGLALAAGAVWIWCRDRAWTGDASETWPVLLALPVAWWLGSPWQVRAVPRPMRPGWFLLAAALGLAGVGLGLTLLLALAWCAAAQGFLEVHCERHDARLLLLAALAFPWITLDFPAAGWWFRQTGAWAAGGGLSLAGFDVQREGTLVLVEGQPMSVDAACAGWNALQAMLIAGAAVAVREVPAGARFALAVLSLPVLAWMANVARITMLGLIALGGGSDLATGPWHEWSGWLVLCAMFLLCRWWCARLSNPGEAVAYAR
jgi:exosortase/archaeosortase family protein